MSDPTHTGTNQATSGLPTVPVGSSALGDFADALYQSESAQAAPEVGHKEYSGTRSGESRVDINHFDPEGVDQLRRTLSNRSHYVSESGDKQARPTSAKSDADTVTAEDAFDFEKVLRGLMQRCARELLPLKTCR